ncbi:hypothetical protein ASG89_03900 [Paenibacillus sp. Soil766]|uniref:CCA tRNA nucleotidyltransferase n=1 Tax=Paenibacillus sp. Soil766 TaxID=1736404 RepID=UPI0007109B8D|nr:CCA tRNA nucleotidyltransferase [Paenibacillus sp. Soil766]KRE98173.1 hypothetical protein ASG89_03900 [Paenibacillus sp. Soil766]
MKLDAGKGMNDPGASEVLTSLMEAGYEAYYVGGCVRDVVLGRPIKDIDIATSALPEQVIQIFQRTVPTGLQHGTVTVLIAQGAYEVTTFRKEAAYEGFRRPASVAYISDLTEDLRRRDFTMNAMAMDVAGVLQDPYGGQTDLAAGVLRCVGIAEERFGEDALRMLRCIRFASTYDLEIEASTWQALLANAPLLRHIAMERVRSELQRMVEGPAPARAVRLLLASGLLAYLKKQLPLPFEAWLAWDDALDVVSALEGQHDRWSMLLMLLEVPADVVRAALQELTFSRADGAAVAEVLALRDAVAAQVRVDDPAPLERVWKLGAVRRGEAAARALLRLLRELPQVEGKRGGLARFLVETAPELLRRGEAWLKEVPCFSLKELAISGQDVAVALDRQPGPWMGRLLQDLLERAALGEIPNEREALIDAAQAAK